jgi:hypothetical protein
MKPTTVLFAFFASLIAAVPVEDTISVNHGEKSIAV